MTRAAPKLPVPPPVDPVWLTAVSLAERNRDLERQLHEMRNSRSWRVTAPLRALLAWFRPSPESTWRPAPLQDSDPGASIAADDEAPRWLVDVTDLAANRFQAGVQRVSRRLLGEWLIAPPLGVRIEPVRLTPQGRYCHARRFLAAFLGQAEGSLGPDLPLQPSAGDQFVGLDLVRDYPEPFAAALAWLKAGRVPVSVVVHDLLPVDHPEWFPPPVSTSFRAWLDAVGRHADRFLCISHATRDSLRRALADAGGTAAVHDVFPLGADLPPWPARSGAATDPGAVRVLTVGTIEPRKGHAEILDAMESLWRQGSGLQWVVIGRPGWGVGALLARLRSHPERGRRLIWVDDGADDEAACAYGDCHLLLSASHGEGYGLPVAEAAALGMPLLLRDIPVFRELAGEHAHYFGGPGAPTLEEALGRFSFGAAVPSATRQWPRWRDSAQALVRILSTPQPPQGGVQESGTKP